MPEISHFCLHQEAQNVCSCAYQCSAYCLALPQPFTFQLHRASKFDIDERGSGSLQDLSEHAHSLKHAQTYIYMYALQTARCQSLSKSLKNNSFSFVLLSFLICVLFTVKVFCHCRSHNIKLLSLFQLTPLRESCSPWASSESGQIRQILSNYLKLEL